MHDTFLLKRISESLKDLCEKNHIARVGRLHMITDINSHINDEHLLEHLKDQNPDIIGDWTKIIIDRQNIEGNTAVIESIEGESIE